MSHIADLMVHRTSASMNSLDAYLFRDDSSHSLTDRPYKPFNPQMESTEEPKFVWRMHKPSQARKYHLFPSRSQEKLTITTPLAKKKDDPAHSVKAATAAAELKNDTSTEFNDFKDGKQRTLERRKNPNVTDLSYMTAIHEASMDSPTIPGRFPVHERSISAPGRPSWRKNDFQESTSTQVITTDYTKSASKPQLPRRNSSSPSIEQLRQRPGKPLAPLIIPDHGTCPSSSDLFPKRTLNRLSEQSVVSDTPPDVPPKSARMLPQYASSSSANADPIISDAPTLMPFTPFTPFSPYSVALTAPLPISATCKVKTRLGSSTISSQRNVSSPLQSVATPKTEHFLSHQHSFEQFGHNPSESSKMLLNINKRSHKPTGSITSTDRGRSTQRPGPPPSYPPPYEPQESRTSLDLPVGFTLAQASSSLAREELESIRAQALGQGTQFSILPSADVKMLSQQLREFDERCTYLRTTHRALRAGRRNLHERLLNHLRSWQTGKISYDGLLTQEEALARLDESIDDWSNRLDVAENRRMRIRQMLLEHVAAALLLPDSRTQAMGMSLLPAGGESTQSSGHSSTTNEQTPPRTPADQTSWLDPTTPLPTPALDFPQPPNHVSTHPATLASSASPAPLLAAPLAPQLPKSPSGSPLPSATHEMLKHYRDSRGSFISMTGRPSAESIRIYAGEDVYTLLADVEAGIAEMGRGSSIILDNDNNDDVVGELLMPRRYEGKK